MRLTGPDTTPLQRATVAIASPRALHEPATDKARAVLEAALDDPNLAERITAMRRPCGHSLPLRYGPVLGQSEPEYQRACSPCLRDRLRAYFLGET